jgi:hypothetical protein
VADDAEFGEEVRDWWGGGGVWDEGWLVGKGGEKCSFRPMDEFEDWRWCGQRLEHCGHMHTITCLMLMLMVRTWPQRNEPSPPIQQGVKHDHQQNPSSCSPCLDLHPRVGPDWGDGSS